MNRRLKSGAVVALAVVLASAGAWGAFRPTPAPVDTAPRFAAAMPRGALVYLEARDLSGLLRAWLKSPVRARYFESASYRSFKRSKLYLKLQDRLSDLQKGFGFELTDQKLAEFAGGPSAIAIYDPGKLELLLATEVSRERALASTVFAQAKRFEERRSAKGALYYSAEVTTDAGSLTQHVAFGYANDRLWVGTSEALLAEALDGPADQGLAPAVAETARGASDFAIHDMLIWFDLDRVLRNKYFNLYWIQRNAKDLEGLSSGLVDLQFAADGVHERRWFQRKGETAAPANSDAAALARLRALAPESAQLVEAKVADSGVPSALAETMFGPERAGANAKSVAFSHEDSPFETTSDTSDDENKRPASGKYKYLDERFDRDVDDAAAAKPAVDLKPAAPRPAAFSDRLGAFVAPAAPVRYATYGSVEMPEGQLFARFDRAVVVELGSPDRFDAAGFEALVASEFGQRFVVGGSASTVAWRDVSGARQMAGALIAQGGAYRVAGPYLIVARDAAQCAALAERATGAIAGRGEQVPQGAVTRVAEVRLAAARGPFARLTHVLDAKSAASINQEVSGEGEDGDGEENADSRPVLFFSQNIASLLDVARDVTTVRIVTTVEGSILREQVDYV